MQLKLSQERFPSDSVQGVGLVMVAAHNDATKELESAQGDGERFKYNQLTAWAEICPKPEHRSLPALILHGNCIPANELMGLAWRYSVVRRKQNGDSPRRTSSWAWLGRCGSDTGTSEHLGKFALVLRLPLSLDEEDGASGECALDPLELSLEYCSSRR